MVSSRKYRHAKAACGLSSKIVYLTKRPQNIYAYMLIQYFYEKGSL